MLEKSRKYLQTLTGYNWRDVEIILLLLRMTAFKEVFHGLIWKVILITHGSPLQPVATCLASTSWYVSFKGRVYDTKAKDTVHAIVLWVSWCAWQLLWVLTNSLLTQRDLPGHGGRVTQRPTWERGGGGYTAASSHRKTQRSVGSQFIISLIYPQIAGSQFPNTKIYIFSSNIFIIAFNIARKIW